MKCNLCRAREAKERKHVKNASEEPKGEESTWQIPLQGIRKRLMKAAQSLKNVVVKGRKKLQDTNLRRESNW